MSSGTPLYQNLDTTFVNLWSLLRKLTQQGFIGRVHVELDDYSADVFLDGSSTPVVREIDRTANTETLETGTLHRVVLRARGTPGTINVFAGSDEATVEQSTASASRPETPTSSSAEPTGSETATTNHDISEAAPPPAATREPETDFEIPPPPPTSPSGITESVYRTGSYQDWPAILTVSGELIGAVERGVNAAGGNFASIFDAVRLELADDYDFLDPFAQTLRYSAGVVSLRTEPAVTVFVSGLGEALRRTINTVAIGDRARRIRERIALEMLPVVRKHAEVLERSGWRAHLDSIVGTTVM
ncbi:MAG TPA: hypothetical protein VHQ64_18010 [Pyrinomonadaceae bacterium]|jgi:hypothetical protein|nr:hypothetical protein [Pyrinomonadaceae bacterium]